VFGGQPLMIPLVGGTTAMAVN